MSNSAQARMVQAAKTALHKKTLTALEQAKLIEWGTYGPGALDAWRIDGTPLPDLIYKKLSDLDTDHLGKILNDGTAGEVLRVAVTLVLEDRTDNNRREAILAQQERNRNG